MAKRRNKPRQAERRARREQAAKAATESPGRDPSTGRFTSGNQAAAGPRVARPSTSYARQLRMSISPEELATVGRTLLAKAIEGDIKAARILFTYLLPAPAQHISIDQNFTDPDITTATEFRRAGASWSQIDREVADHLANLVREQAEYDAALAATREAH